MNNEKNHVSNEKKHVFDNPRNVRLVLWFLYGCCGLLLLLDFVIHRHVAHPWEGLWGFYPIYGFVGCVILVIVAKWMRTFLMRSEDYYDEVEAMPASTTHANKQATQSTDTNVADEKKPGGDHV